MKFVLSILCATCLLATILSAQETAPAKAPPAPYVVAAFNADLIVVGEITSDANPQTLTAVTLPGEQKQQESRKMEVYEMKVTQVIREGAPTGRFGPAQTTQPTSQPAGVGDRTIKVMVAADREAFLRQPAAAQVHRIALAKDVKLVAALQKLPGREEYYLSPICETANSFCEVACFRADATDENIKNFTAAADDSKWQWGKEVDGLRLALIVTPEVEASYPPIMVVNGTKGLNMSFGVAVGVRNVSAKPLAVNLYDLKGGLSVQTVDDNGIIRKGTLYGGPRPPAKHPPVFDKSYIKVLQPGEVAMVGSEGLAPLGCSLEILLDYRSWKLSAAYEVDGEAKTEDGQALWKGKLQSAPVDINVVRIPAININGPGQTPPT